MKFGKGLYKMKLEYDGSIVICGEIVGKINPDCLTEEEVKELNERLVHRWNKEEDPSS